MTAGEFIGGGGDPQAQAGEVFHAHCGSAKRFDQDISALCAAMRYRLEGGKLTGLCFAVNGVTPFPGPRAGDREIARRPPSVDVGAAELDAVVATSFPHRDGLRASWPTARWWRAT